MKIITDHPISKSKVHTRCALFYGKDHSANIRLPSILLYVKSKLKLKNKLTNTIKQTNLLTYNVKFHDLQKIEITLEGIQ